MEMVSTQRFGFDWSILEVIWVASSYSSRMFWKYAQSGFCRSLDEKIDMVLKSDFWV